MLKETLMLGTTFNRRFLLIELTIKKGTKVLKKLMLTSIFVKPNNILAKIFIKKRLKR